MPFLHHSVKEDPQKQEYERLCQWPPTPAVLAESDSIAYPVTSLLTHLSDETIRVGFEAFLKKSNFCYFNQNKSLTLLCNSFSCQTLSRTPLLLAR